MFAPLHHPAMQHAAPVRRELARVRSSTSSGPSRTPQARAPRSSGCIRPMSSARSRTRWRCSESQRAFVVHGAYGVDELSPAGPNLVFEVVDGDGPRAARRSGGARAPALRSRGSRGGSPAGERRDGRRCSAATAGGEARAVVLNAAGAIAAAGTRRTSRRASGWRTRPSTGARRGRLAELVAFSRESADGRFADALARPGSRRSRRSSGARRPRATCGPMPIPPSSPPRTSGPARRRCRSSSTSGSAARGTTCGRRAPRPRCRCSRRASSRARTTCGPLAKRAPMRHCSSCAISTTTPVARLLAAAADLGLETLVEAHDARGARRGRSALGAPVIGINARDLCDVRDRPRCAARARRARAARSRRGRRERDRVARAGRRGRARGRGRDPRRLDAHARSRSRSEARRAPVPAAREGLRATREEDVAAAAEAGADMAGFVLVDASPRRAPRVLPVPDTMLRWPSSSASRRATRRPRPALPAENGKVRGRDAVLLRNGRGGCARPRPAVAGGGSDAPRARARAEGRIVLAGGLGPENVRAAIEAVRPWAVDASSSLETGAGVKDHDRVRAYVAAARGDGAAYGTYGGRYVPETLDPGTRRARAGLARRRSPIRRSGASSTLLASATSGRPTPLYEAERFAPRPPDPAQARGPLPHGRAQDQQRPRPGPARGAARQAAHRRGDGRRASTASRPRPSARASGSSASSTWAPRTCAGSIRTSSACGCSARRCAPVEFGTRTLKEATSEAIRDWIANVETTYYLIGSCVGPHPYPAIVRELQAVIGREARAQMLEAYGRLPEAVVACVGGGSNAIGLFAGLPRRRRGRARRRRGGRRGEPRRRPRRPSCTGRARRCSRTRTARCSTRTRSRPASTTRASGRSTLLRDSGRAGT